MLGVTLQLVEAFTLPSVLRLHLTYICLCWCTDSLHRHLEHLHIEYLQFAFRWMNNLLMREMPLRCVIRLWDTYLVPASWISNTVLSFSVHRILLICGFPCILDRKCWKILDFDSSSFSVWSPCADSGVVRIDPLHFLAGCRTRRLNQV